jgi:hypothetical protein
MSGKEKSEMLKQVQHDKIFRFPIGVCPELDAGSGMTERKKRDCRVAIKQKREAEASLIYDG